jgi:pimeloyl-ACP methyl ester carboxylesterase
MELLQLTSDIEVGHIGPPLERKPLPAVIYFALSAEESLNLDPYNQPALYLANQGGHLFSFNLPAHGPHLNALDAIEAWAHSFEKGEDPLTPFLEKTVFAVETLISRGHILREKIGVMGLSRGGLIGSLFATRFPHIRAIVGFAPMTKLTRAREFVTLSHDERVSRFNLENAIDLLCDIETRYYIGNRDVRVGTDVCFELVQRLAEAAFQKGLRSPPIEMIVRSSIGHMGHGTSKETFEDGAHWLGTKLGLTR